MKKSGTGNGTGKGTAIKGLWEKLCDEEIGQGHGQGLGHVKERGDMQTLFVHEKEDSITLTFNRLEKQNSINTDLLEEINDALDLAESNPKCLLVILKGQAGTFCTGMDFQEVIGMSSSHEIHDWTSKYMELLKRLTLMPKIIVSLVDGKALAGGLGLVAASDWVIATEDSTFKLTEALWGLLPAMVAPYLIRRIGFHPAYSMALSCRTISAREAMQLHLVDEINEEMESAYSHLTRRFGRLELSTIKRLKDYFRSVWLIDNEMESRAIEVTTRLLQDSGIRENIHDFIQEHKYPWDKKK
jgi:polyketide biosynthesis enoyl-CoA hydratase PksH